MNSWVIAFLNWSPGWHIERKCQTDRLKFHLDTSRWVCNREIDLRLVHIKTVINFVLTDESGSWAKRRKPQADCSTRLKVWANIFLPCFHAHEIMCALSHHLLQWFLKHRNQIFHRPEPSEESYSAEIGYWQQHTLSEKQDVFQFWEPKGLLAYVQTVSYVLNIACEWETFYMTLWEEKKKSHWYTLLKDLETETADLFHWPDVDFKSFLDPVKKAPGWFRWQSVIPTQDLCGAWRGPLTPVDTQKMSIHHKTGSEVLCGGLIFTGTQLLQSNSQ